MEDTHLFCVATATAEFITPKHSFCRLGQRQLREKHCLLLRDSLPPQSTAFRPRNATGIKIHFVYFKALFSPWRHPAFFRSVDSAQEEGITELNDTEPAWEAHQLLGRTRGNEPPSRPFQLFHPSPARVPARSRGPAHPLAGAGHRE